MVATSRLGKQISEIIATLNGLGAEFALIGGLALASHRVNDPRRTQDLEDIRALLRANLATLNIDEVREYFRLFGRESLLEELLNATS